MKNPFKKAKTQGIKVDKFVVNVETQNIEIAPIPPDGGWGWVIVASSFLISFIVDGVINSFGVFLNEHVVNFGEGRGKAAWIGSALVGTTLGIGPFVGALCNQYGCRLITVIGSFFAAFAIFASTFSPSINVLIIVYGILGGIGLGMMYLPSVVIVGYYFTARRAFATGIAVCGSGMGTLIIGPLANYLINEYGWKGAMWIMSGMVLHGALGGLTYRPLVSKVRKVTPKVKKGVWRGVRLLRPRMFKAKHIERKKSTPLSITGTIDGDIITVTRQTLANIGEIEHEIEDDVDSFTVGSFTVGSQVLSQLDRFEGTDGVKQKDSLVSVNSPLDTSTKARRSYTFMSDAGSEVDPFKLAICRHADPVRTGTKDPSVFSGGTYASWTSTKLAKEAARPMYRQDIFYNGSIANISEFKTQVHADIHSYLGSVLLFPITEEKDEGTLKESCVPLVSVLKKMFDVKILKNRVLVYFLVANCISTAGFYTPLVFMIDLAELRGIPRDEGSYLLSILGISNTVGRIVTGFVTDRPWADSLVIHNVAMILGGISIITVPFFTNYAMFAVFACVYAVFIASFITVKTIVLVDLLGMQQLTSSYGWVLFSMGVASLVGTPFSGFLLDLTGTYTLPFILAGSFMILGGTLLFGVKYISKWEKRKKAKKPQKDAPSRLSDVAETNEISLNEIITTIIE